ncbi:AtpZ/AtpI family protein [Dactylosporangium sp. NPDC005572]|uniref:AtpZ/AtpI family protein n=1 Tax=Dactylosporangium sp. NPDC005572 TaxID=3156889 RepID=UPI0033B081E5
MAGNQTPKQSGSSGSNEGWAAVGYLISGIAVWGFIGWLVDQWLGSDGIATAIGCVLGAAGGIYLVVKRLGA